MLMLGSVCSRHLTATYVAQSGGHDANHADQRCHHQRTDDAATGGQLAVSLITLILLATLLVVDIKFLRDSRRIAKSLDLPKGQWLRQIKSLAFDPAIELLVVGVLLAQDLVQNWEHVVAGLAGAAVGVLAGHYRFRIQYVRAVPEHKAIVFVRSREEYVALVILVLVRMAAEQHRIPIVGALTLLVTLLLAVVVFESIGRAWFSYRAYKHDTSSLSVGAQASSRG